MTKKYKTTKGQKMNNTTQKPIQTLQELAKKLKSDRYYFVSPCSAGDTYYLCAFKRALEKHLQGKIIFVIKPTHKVVCEIYEIEPIICDSVFLNTFQQSKCLENPFVTSVPTLGNLYPAHPIPLNKLRYHYKTMTEMYVDFFDLPFDTKGVLPTNLPNLSQSLREKLAKIAPLGKIFLLCPEAHTFPILPSIIFKDECEKLLKLGYKIIVNIPNRKEYTRYFSAKRCDCFGIALCGCSFYALGLLRYYRATLCESKNLLYDFGLG